MDTGEDPLPRLVAVWGPNEAGKSSLFAFLTAMLYGFHPATRDRNPFTPWSGEDIEGRIEIRTDAGESLTVHRRLLASGWGRLRRDTIEEDIRNQPLDLVRHVPERLFSHLYALTLAELATLERETWQEIQDRLIGSMGSPDLVPPRRAAARLLDEAATLWRSDNRGKPETRRLRDRLLEVHRRLQRAEGTDRRLRQVADQLAITHDRLHSARALRAESRTLADHLRVLVPLRRQLMRLRELEAEAGPAEALAGLPPDPEQALADLSEREGELRLRQGYLVEDEQQLADQVARFGEREQRILDSRQDIEEAILASRAADQGGQRLHRLGQELRDLERRCEAIGREILTEPWTELDPDTLAAAAAGHRLRDLTREYVAAHEARAAREQALDWLRQGGGPRRSPVLPPWVPAVLLVAGLALFVSGTVSDTRFITALGALVTLAGLVGTALVTGDWLGRRHSSRSPGKDSPETELGRAKEAEGESRTALVQALQGLPVRGPLVETPHPELVSSLERLRELLMDRADRHRALDELSRDRERMAEQTAHLAAKVGMDLPPELGALAFALEREVRAAERLQAEAVAAGRELARIRRERERVDRDLEGIREEMDSTLSRIKEATGNEGPDAVRRVTERLLAAAGAHQIRTELDFAHPNLEDLTERIRQAEDVGEPWVEDEDALASAAAREEELSDEIEVLRGEVERLEQEQQHLQQEETVDQIEGERLALKEEIRLAERQRDRKFLLATIIREADRSFREEHQPEVVRRAGEYLAIITDRRYDRLVVGEEESGDPFLLRGPGYPHAMPVERPISTGTREQVYLALRLAVIDHLDAGSERLPLFIDEAFVNWDARRRERGLQLLQQVSGQRQLFVFTCHEPLVAAMERLGARVLPLRGP